MKTFVVEGAPARFGAGTRVGLTPAQYEVRKHNIDGGELAEGRYLGVAKVPLEFKVGETILIEGDEPKAVVNPLSGEALSKPQRRRVAAAKKKADAAKAAKPHAAR